MKISELIDRLQELQVMYGDAPVYTREPWPACVGGYTRGYSYSEVEDVAECDDEPGHMYLTVE